MLVIRSCLRHSSAVELGDKAGNTALHIAAQYGNIKLMRYLVEQGGASVWALNDDGKTPCETAAEAEQNAAFRYLDALQLRMRMDDSGKADKSRQRARKEWAKRLDKKQKLATKECGAEKAVASLRKDRASESVLPSTNSRTRGDTKSDLRERELKQVLRHQAPRKDPKSQGRGRTISEPIPVELVTDSRQHPDIAELDSGGDDNDSVFRTRSQSLLYGKTRSNVDFADTKARSFDLPTSSTNRTSTPMNQSRSPEDQSPAQAMARYQSSNLRSRVSLRPSTSGSGLSNSTSGLGTDLSGMSSVDTSIGSTSGSRTAQAIARIKSLGGLNALTHSTQAGGGRMRKISAPVLSSQQAKGEDDEESSFRRYRTGNEASSSNRHLQPVASAFALLPTDTRSQAGAMNRSTSSASAKSKMSASSLPTKPQARTSQGKLHMLKRKSTASTYATGGNDDATSDFDEIEVSPMATFLHMLDIDDQLALLEEEHMDLDALMLCTDLDLKDLDMGLGPRRKILAAVQKRKAVMAATSPLLSDSQI